ncbi:CHAP domain-containing protein [Gordonia sp. ABKF26]|uniref:CHAP domain-containing protein n=1 Tax=Gordonia sp. ABKF26 TaxID=3238687 RepID=UPI0034E5C996
MDSHTSIPAPDPAVFVGLVPVEHDELQGGEPDGLAGSLGLQMVYMALGERGVCETGQNGGIPLQRYVRAFWPQSGPQPWCAFFVSWCYLRTGNRRPPWANPGLVSSVRTWARSAGMLHSRPKQGDMFGTGSTHMGLVRGVNNNGTFVTLEGNTSTGCVTGFVRSASTCWFATPR